MGRRAIQLELKHSVEELKSFYQKSTNAVERRRAQVVWLLASGKSRQEVMEITAYSLPRLLDAIHYYNNQGLAGLRDQRKDNPGAPTLLTDEQVLLLAQTIRHDYKQGKTWRGADVEAWLKNTLNKEVHYQRAYELLQAIGFTLQVPRPHHTKSDEAAQHDLKKTSYPKLSKQLKKLLETIT